jgi:broad specificity phosphatase PhoE
MALSVTVNAEIYLVRHGETEWNAEGRFQGQKDSPLTRGGRDQAHRVGRRLADVVTNHTRPQMHISPLGRTRETADILRQYRDYAPPVFDARLQEVTVGSWDGLTPIDIDAGWPGRLDGTTPFDWYFRSPDGENYEAAVRRIQAWLTGLSGAIIAVSHGLIGRVIRGAYLGLSREEALCLPVPQTTIWHLRDARARAIEASPTAPSRRRGRGRADS